MPDLVYNVGKDRLGGALTAWNSASLKVLLVTSTYVPNADDLVVSTAVASSAEIVATNYVGGFNGAGRKVLGTKSHASNTTSDRAEFFGTLPTWTALGGATNATIAGAVLFEEITSDALSPLLAYFVVSPALTTNSSDFTLSWASSLVLTLT